MLSTYVSAVVCPFRVIVDRCVLIGLNRVIADRGVWASGAEGQCRKGPRACHTLPLPSIPYSPGATPPSTSSQLPPQFVSHVVHYVEMHRYNFALHLGISSTILDCVLVEKQGLTSDCCLESLHRWCRHDRDTGGKGREVGVVLEAARKACGPVAVDRIQSSWQSSEVRPTRLTPLLQSTPELAALQELVVPSVAAQWEAIADYLLVSYEK